MRVALATAAHLPELAEDDQVLLAALRAAGVDVTPAIWDEPVDWLRYDIVVVRSIWDYHLKYERFLKWLDELDIAGVRVYNSTSIMRWNSDKRYMLELHERGILVTPTHLVTRGEIATLGGVLDQTGWTNAVVKPSVSASGHETWFVRAPADAEAEQRFAEQVEQMDVLVQEFAEGVKSGERSFVFIGGSYSHTVLKRAAGDEFRVHIEHGGTVEAITPPPEQISWASTVVEMIADPWTYARVDAVPHGDGLMLMELELLEPELFFKYEPAAAQRMIAALGLESASAR